MKLPIIIYNKLIPFKGYVGMVTLGILWIRSEFKDTRELDEAFYRHESIHVIQQTEIAILSLILSIAPSILTGNWWMLLIAVISPLILYIVCWLIEIINPTPGAYKCICFETEAIYNEYNSNYLKTRKLFQFKFLKYISNKKYPYLNKISRKRLYQ